MSQIIKSNFALVFPCVLIFASWLNADSAQDQPGLAFKDFGINRPHQTPVFEPEALRSLKEEDFAKMPLSDPRLRSAYIYVFLDNIASDIYPEGTFDEFEYAALRDMIRRGDSVGPLLLELMATNAETTIEAVMIDAFREIPALNVSPFLAYARTAIKTRGQTMTASLVVTIANMFIHKGTTEDVQMLRDLAAKRPYLEYSISRELELAKLPGLPPKKVQQPGSNADPPTPADQSWFTSLRLSQWFFWVSVGFAVFIAAKIGWRLTHKKQR